MDFVWGVFWFIVVVTLIVMALQNGAVVGVFIHDLILGAIDLVRSAVTGS